MEDITIIHKSMQHKGSLVKMEQFLVAVYIIMISGYCLSLSVFYVKCLIIIKRKYFFKYENIKKYLEIFVKIRSKDGIFKTRKKEKTRIL